MLITCPNCQTTYNIPSTDNPEQKVRCVKCDHVWKIAFNGDDSVLADFSLTEDSKPKEPDIPFPALHDIFKEPEKDITFLLKWLKPLYFVSLFCIAISIYLFFFHTPSRAPVTLQTVSHEILQNDYKPYLILQAAAFNNTKKDIRPELFTARFVDKNGRLLTTISLKSPIDRLPANGVEQIDFQIERPPSKTATVTLTLTKMRSL